MRAIVTVGDPRDWPLDVPGVEVVRAHDYLADPRWSKAKGVRVYNLCRDYRYQRNGYYVSLLASARGHVTMPSLSAILDMKSRAMVRLVDDELEELVQRSLSRVASPEFHLSVYFGRNMAERYARLASRLFNLFPAPLLRAWFAREKPSKDGRGQRWKLQRVVPISARDVPEAHMPFVLESARTYFLRPHFRTPRKGPRYDLAILHDPEQALTPSDEGAIRRFERAGRKVGFGVERIKREDFARLPEFDALFIRETTYVNHHTFRFAQRAEAEGLAVIDDPQSILRCTNKVYLAEALEQRRIPMPRTLIANRSNVEDIAPAVGLPCVLKWPDSSFSQGVVKCSDEEELQLAAEKILEASDLFVCQEFLPTPYDWRIGVLEGRALYACRYHMADGHWQIVQKTGADRYRYGRIEPVPLDLVPGRVVSAAVRAAKVIGNGLYGVDVKDVRRRAHVIEVNDNPSIDAGCEDALLGSELYERIVQTLMIRVERLKEPRK